MKSSRTKLVAISAIALVSLSATSALACGGGGRSGGFGGGYGGGQGGFPGNHGGRYGRSNQGQYCESNSNSGKYGGQAYEPYHSSYFVQPGDTFYEVSLKEYGTSANARHIAQFNRLASNAALVPGQRLMLPSISASGRLSQSRSPAPEVVNNSPITQNFATSRQTPAQAASSVKTVEESLPQIAVGSTLAIDGTVLGDDQGVVRLRIGAISFPVEVIEWSSSSATIRLPELEVTEATKAEIEILRADGSVASKSSVELTPGADRLARAN